MNLEGAVRAKLVLSSIEAMFADAAIAEPLSDKERDLLQRLSLYIYQMEDGLIDAMFSCSFDEATELLEYTRHQFLAALNSRPMKVYSDESR